MGWVLGCLDDIVSDMSVFHRVDDITALDGPTFFRLAWRLPVYQGAMRARVEDAHDSDPATRQAAAAAGSVARAGTEWNPGLRSTLMADPVLKGIFEFS